jgi:tRNA (guanosine-2'-O-)-methyltransferase
MKHFPAYAFSRHLPSPVGPHPLEGSLTEERRERFRQVLARRVTSLTVVLEDCYDPHNATAVMRTCEAFGIHRIHVLTGRNSFKVNRRISQGSHRYVDLVVHKEVEEAYGRLKTEGFRIVAAHLGGNAVTDPHDLTVSLKAEPLALVFGNEESGVSNQAADLADGSFVIPMCGFTQSLNLSVCVAVTLFSLRHRAMAANDPGDMDAKEQCLWFDRWVRRQVGTPDST